MTAPLELSRRVLAEQIGRTDSLVEVEADAQERVAVAARLLIPAIAALSCRWTLRPGERGMISGHGALRAAITQICVVSLDPFDTVVREEFEVLFVPDGQQSEDDDPDEPDQLVYDGVAVDVGEATVEQLALTLDPYPRKPGAKLTLPDVAEAGGAFTALAKLHDLD